MKNLYMENILEKDQVFYAHRAENKQKELLKEHLALTFENYIKMEQYKRLDVKIKQILQRVYPTITENGLNVCYDLFKSAIYYHDIGKINPIFQAEKMEHEMEEVKVKKQDSHHSALSAKIYMDAFLQDLQNNSNHLTEQETVFCMFMIFCFGYIISRHHSDIENLNHFIYDLQHTQDIAQLYEFSFSTTIYENICDRNNWDTSFAQLNLTDTGIYILCKLLYSCMITSDYYATYEYMNDGKKVEFDLPRKMDLFDGYKGSELYQKIRSYQKNEEKITGINQIRTDIFLEVEENLTNNMQHNLFYLEAPTGSGKTNMAINMARILYENIEEIKSIYYIFPFNTLIEQTDQKFEEYFKKYWDYMVINSITPMVEDVDETLNFDDAYMRNVFRHFPITMTSHVNLFDSLFGTSKNNNYTLYDFIDSVIVLDEIQSYSNNIWKEMITMLKEYADLLHIKIIIMSATLPKLEKLLKDNNNLSCDLITDPQKYYQNPIFRNRVTLNFSLLDKKLTIEDIVEQVLQHKGKSVLVECIKKDTARQLFCKLKEKYSPVFELTGDDNSFVRKKIIAQIKNLKDVIVVATQTIEAGVDIDMDIGFKDISFLDNEEQFLGRINRSSKKDDSVAFFFNYDDASKIYRNDQRIEYHLQNQEVQQWLEEKNFKCFYQKVMEKIDQKATSYTKQNIKNLYDSCRRLDYLDVKNKLKLIEANTVQIFLNDTIQLDDKVLKRKRNLL